MKEEVASPAASVHAALALSDPLERAAALVPTLQSLSSERPDEFESVVLVFEGYIRDDGDWTHSLGLLAEPWVDIDPEAAFRRAQSWPRVSRRHGVGAIVRAWARRNPAAARAKVETLPDSPLKTVAFRALLQGWAETDDPAIWEFVANSESGKSRAAIFSDRVAASKIVAGSIFRRHGIDAAIASVEAISEDMPGQVRYHGLRSVGGILARTDPASAISFTEKHADGKFGGPLIRDVAHDIAAVDGALVMGWLRDKSEQQDYWLTSAYRSWMESQPDEARVWFEENRNEPEFEGLLPLHAKLLGQSDVRVALDFAQSIERKEARSKVLMAVGVKWLRERPETARPWLRSHFLLEEVEELMQSSSPNRLNKVRPTLKSNGPTES
jgi:hypothetical protein